MTATVLATGGAGYIGSHVVAELLAGGRRVVVLDDFSNAARRASSGWPSLGQGRAELVRGDIRDAAALDAPSRAGRIDAVIHLAGLKAVGGVGGGAAALLGRQRRRGGGAARGDAAARRRGGWSSPRRRPSMASRSATRSPRMPGSAPHNPYGRTKLAVEEIIADLVVARPELAAVSLRYFNPVGATSLGPDRRGTRRGCRTTFSRSSPRPPPACATACASSAATIRRRTAPGCATTSTWSTWRAATWRRSDFLLAGRGARGGNIPINLGCGRGYSVREALAAFSRAGGAGDPARGRRAAAGRRRRDAWPTRAAPRRSSAGARAWGSTTMCADHWAFQSRQLPGAIADRPRPRPARDLGRRAAANAARRRRRAR